MIGMEVAKEKRRNLGVGIDNSGIGKGMLLILGGSSSGK